MELRCIIVEDEPFARQLLIDYCSRVPYLRVVGEFSNGMSAMEFLYQNKVDFLFLDIMMPRLMGIELVKILNPKPQVIFTTAFSDYAVEGFDLDAVDYLLKPFDFVRFLKAVNKLNKIFHFIKSNSSQENKEYFFIKDGRDQVRLEYGDILFIKGFGDYVQFFCKSKKITTLMTMKELENTLPNSFHRIHQSYIINENHITLVRNNQVKIDEYFLSVSRSYAKEFQKFLANRGSQNAQ